MLKTKSARHLLTLIIIAGVTTGLLACSGNDSSTTLGPPPVIDPVEVDKIIEDMEWNSGNEVKMASYAYRAVARHSMLATLYSGQSAIFSTFINLVQGTRDRSCNVSGSIDAVLVEAQCKDANNIVDCTVTDPETGEEVSNSNVLITTTEQSAIFYQCQDGITSGSYFNGPLRVVLRDDFSIDDIYINTTTVSAIAQVSQQGENGKFVLDTNDEVVKVGATDFLMQNEFNTFFMSYEYNLATEYDTSSVRFSSRGIEECQKINETVDASIVTQEVLSSDFVAGLQEPSPQFPYTEFTDLDLIATNDHFRCEDLDDAAGNESLRYDTTYSLATKIESKALGRDTQFDWTGLVIPTDQTNIGGTITLTHINTGSVNYVVTVEFEDNGNLVVSGPSVSTSMTVQEFLDLSKAE